MPEPRIFSLDDLSNGTAEEAAPASEGIVMPRKRDVTQSRRHAFLRQTFPPKDPVVREVERRRSGASD